jgi:hypothetical protein
VVAGVDGGFDRDDEMVLGAGDFVGVGDKDALIHPR